MKYFKALDFQVFWTDQNVNKPIHIRHFYSFCWRITCSKLQPQYIISLKGIYGWLSSCHNQSFQNRICAPMCQILCTEVWDKPCLTEYKTYILNYTTEEQRMWVDGKVKITAGQQKKKVTAWHLLMTDKSNFCVSKQARFQEMICILAWFPPPPPTLRDGNMAESENAPEGRDRLTNEVHEFHRC